MKQFFWDQTTPRNDAPPVTDELVQLAEQKLSVTLPTAYVDLLKTQNGGYVGRYDSFPTPVPTSWSEDHISIRSIMGIGPNPAGDILDSLWLTEEWGMARNLVLLDGDGHIWVALDYRTCGPTGEPSVVWIDNELEEEVQLAPDFQTFLDGLVDGNSDFVFGFTSLGDTSEQLAAQLSDILGTQLVEAQRNPSLSDIVTNWPEYKDASSRYLLYINRDAEGRYIYPEYPDCQWVLACEVAEAQGEALAAALKEEVSVPVVRIHTPQFASLYVE